VHILSTSVGHDGSRAAAEQHDEIRRGLGWLGGRRTRTRIAGTGLVRGGGSLRRDGALGDGEQIKHTTAQMQSVAHKLHRAAGSRTNAFEAKTCLPSSTPEGVGYRDARAAGSVWTLTLATARNSIPFAHIALDVEVGHVGDGVVALGAARSGLLLLLSA